MVDLSADFRFKDAAVYEHWYQPHSAQDLLAEAVYGLPELHGYAVSRARLVGNPGCYPTCVILGLAPLVQNKLVCLDSLIADCKSGVSGAGRQAGAGHPVLRGQRRLQGLQGGGAPPQPGDGAGVEPAGRGAGATHLHPAPGAHEPGHPGDPLRPAGEAPDRSGDSQLLPELLCRTSPLSGSSPRGVLPNTINVRGSNYCDIGVKVDAARGRVIVVSAIDNLHRGAAGQAVHNFNLMMGFPETTGLDLVPLIP